MRSKAERYLISLDFEFESTSVSLVDVENTRDQISNPL